MKDRDGPIDIIRSIKKDEVFLISGHRMIYRVSRVQNSLCNQFISWVGFGNLIHILTISVSQDRIVRQNYTYDILGQIGK